MASPLENALLSDEYQDSLQNPLTEPKSSWRDEMDPDYESEPPPVTLGDDGNYYANDNRWNYGEWVTYVGDVPVYWVEGGTERDKVDDDQFEMDEFGNVITKDADLVGNGKALNPSGQWMTEEQIRNRWDSSDGMSIFKKANPNMSVDEYMSFVKDSTALQAQGIERLGEGGLSPEYQALYDKYGVATEYTDSSGNRYDFNGGTYTKTVDGVDMGSQILHGAVLGILGAGISAGLAPVLTSALGPAGAKAASSAITSLAKQYMMTGDISFEDAMLSAALSYGGSQLSDLIEGSGVLSDLSSQFDSIAGDLVNNGGDILKSALTAGGMSLVTQMVKNGEIDWKDAAIAAAMAGGTTALQGFLSDIGKSDQVDDLSEWDEFDEWQEEAMKADIKDPFLNPNYETVGDGLVMNIATGEVFSQGGVDSKSHGLFSDLDKDGDGQLSGSDLEFIDTSDLTKKNIYNYELGDTVYVDANGNPVDPKLVKMGPDGYIGYDANGNRVPLTATTYDQVFGGGKGELEWQFGLNEDGSVSTTDGAIYYENGELAYEKVNGQWQDSQGNIIDDPTKVDELTMIAAKAIDEPLNSVTYFDQDGNPISYKYPPADLQDNYEQGQFSGLIFGPNGEVREVWYDPVTNTEYVKAQGTTEIIAIREPETPPAIDNSTDQNSADGNPNNDSATGDPNDSSDAGMGNGGGNTDSTGGDEGADGTAGGSDGGSTGGGYTGGGIDTGDIGSGGDDSSSGTTTPTPTDPNANPVDPSGGNTGGNTDNTGGNTTNDSGNGTNTGSGTESGDGGVTGSETGTGSGSGSGDGSSSGTESGSGNTGSGSGTGSSGTGAGSDGTTGGGAGTGAGTGGGVGGGTGGNTGGGEGEVDGSGSGTEAGSGDGAGGGGAGGGGLGNGQGMLSGNNSSDRPVWGPLFAGNQFKPRDKARAQVKARLFDDLFKDYV